MTKRGWKIENERADDPTWRAAPATTASTWDFAKVEPHYCVQQLGVGRDDRKIAASRSRWQLVWVFGT